MAGLADGLPPAAVPCGRVIELCIGRDDEGSCWPDPCAVDVGGVPPACNIVIINNSHDCMYVVK